VVPADRPSLEDILLHHWMMQSCEQVDDVKLHETDDQQQQQQQRVTGAHRTTVDDVDLNMPPSEAPPAPAAVCRAVVKLCDGLQASTISALSHDKRELSNDLCYSADSVQLYNTPSSDVCVELCADRSIELCAESVDRSVGDSERSTERCAADAWTERCVRLLSVAASSSHSAVVNLRRDELLSDDDVDLAAPARRSVSRSHLSHSVEDRPGSATRGHDSRLHDVTQKLTANTDGYCVELPSTDSSVRDGHRTLSADCSWSVVDSSAALDSSGASTVDSLCVESLKPSS